MRSPWINQVRWIRYALNPWEMSFVEPEKEGARAPAPAPREQGPATPRLKTSHRQNSREDSSAVCGYFSQQPQETNRGVKHKCEKQLFQDQWTHGLLFLSLKFPARDTARAFFWRKRGKGKWMWSLREGRACRPSWERFQTWATACVGISLFPKFLVREGTLSFLIKLWCFLAAVL